MPVLCERIAADDPVWNLVRALHGGGRWVGVTRLRRGGWIIRAVAPGGQELRDLMTELRTLLATVLPGLRSDLRKL
jgi:urease accessory protein UreH